MSMPPGFSGVVVTPYTEHDKDGNPTVPVKVVQEFLSDYYTLQLGDDWTSAATSEKANEFPVELAALQHLRSMQTSLQRHCSSGQVPLVELQLRQYVAQRKSKTVQKTKTPLVSLKNIPDRVSHIVIIGAGAAGLACAQRIRQRCSSAGFSDKVHVTVLEGRSRLGGRVYTARSHDVIVDLGAMWFHGLVDNVAYELQPDEKWRLFQADEAASVMFEGVCFTSVRHIDNLLFVIDV